MPRQQTWTDQQLIEAVAASTCFKQICDALGLWPGGGTYRTLERHMERLSIDCSHLARRMGPRGTNGRRRWTDEELAEAVAASQSWSEVSRRLGCKPSGGAHRWLKAHVVHRRLDTSHFTSQGWAKGLKFPGRRTTPLEELLVNGSTATSSDIRRRLIAEGLRPAKCELCGLEEWYGRPISLELDHINGDHTDNRLENLRIVCPNCHSTTETYCRRKRNASVPVVGFEPTLKGA